MARDKVIGSVEYDDVTVLLYEGRLRTIRQVEEPGGLSERAIRTIYRIVTGDDQPILWMDPVVQVVKGQLDIDWHEVNEIGVSETMAENQERRRVSAKKTAGNAEAAAEAQENAPKTKAPRATIKSLICGMLKEQVDNPEITDEAIHAAIKERFPDSKAAQDPGLHTNYYRSALANKGEIPKRERAARTRKAKDGEAAPAAEEAVVVEA